MIETKHLIEYIEKEKVLNFTPSEREYKAEIVARLRAYDRICRDLKQLITRLSIGVDG